MNTIIDLNVADNINYNNQADYAISFGTNLGNTTANIDGFTSANISKQTTLNSISSPVRDLLIDVQFNQVDLVNMEYQGIWSNIGLLPLTPDTWRVSGIRSVAQYNEAFANVKYTDITGGNVGSPDYNYTTTVNDQAGNTRTWTTQVNVIQQPEMSISGPVIYNEDTLTPVTVATITVDPDSNKTFRLYANTASTYGTMTDGVITGNSISIDGNAASLNSQITAGALKFLPASDYVSNAANAINLNLTSLGSSFVNQANANIQIGTVHAEYYFPTTGVYVEDRRYNYGNTITDLDTHAISYTVTFLQTAGPAGYWYVNDTRGSYANTALIITGSKASINNSVKWEPVTDSTANVSFTYTQIKTLPSGNVTQANAVAADFVCTPNDEIQNMINRNYSSNTVNQIFSTTTPYIDETEYGQNYEISLASAAGRFGTTTQNLANTWTYSGTMTQVNNTFPNILFVPFRGQSANSTFTYTQNREGQPQVNVTRSLTGTVVAVANSYSYTSDATYRPTFTELYYGSNARVIVVGAGGGGGRQSDTPYAGGGGGAGQIVDTTFGVLPNLNYSIQIGTPGAGASGVNEQGGIGGISRFGLSTAYVKTAAGGIGGDRLTRGSGGNIGGSPPAYTGGFYSGNATVGYGGGGAGATANGTNAVTGTSGAGGSGQTISGVGTFSVGGGGAGTDRTTGATATNRGSGGGGRASSTGAAATGIGGGIYIIWT